MASEIDRVGGVEVTDNLPARWRRPTEIRARNRA